VPRTIAGSWIERFPREQRLDAVRLQNDLGMAPDEIRELFAQAGGNWRQVIQMFA
jgi:hypothetical protein